ncbi:endolytic transglycosylase MltG [Legionella erythra]|uniref:Endolytic murein transglycosylase n=1 Tax=Legionella erythra TaxID=448 RepID=A0A0W0TRU3_LEGER|nr:endolytic transglycosylase MltG [Legionella erythra]KTC98139.1 periplasmic solute-binding protein [Legionella erythra]
MKTFFKWFFFVTALSLVLFFTLFTYNVNALLTKPLLPSESKPLILEIKPNSTAVAFVNHLHDLHLIGSKKMFLSFMTWQGYSNRLKAGIYQITPGETAQQLLDKVISGEVLVQSFRIIEGTTLAQVTENLKKAPYLAFNEEDIHAFSGSHPSPEGLFLADTYNYDAGDNAKALLKVANHDLLNYLNAAWKERSPGLPYDNAYQLLIAASILEKETALATERKLISGVIVNRLKKNMLLQMDPTVIYAFGKHFDGKLRHEHLSIDSPYNTYKNHGLPPTPIAMVGKESIDAAAHPKPSHYLYFVAKGDGSHEFSETYGQQKKAILRYKYKIKESSQ